MANSQAYGQALFATLAETFWCSIYGILSSRADEWVFLGDYLCLFLSDPYSGSVRLSECNKKYASSVICCE